MKTYLSLVALLLLPLLTLAQDPIKIAFVGNSITKDLEEKTLDLFLCKLVKS